MHIDELRTRLWPGPGRWRGAGVITAVGLGLVVGTVYAGVPADASVGALASGGTGAATGAAPAATAPPVRVGGAAEAVTASRRESAEPSVMELAARVERVSERWADVGAYYESEIAPIEDVLLRYRADSVLVGRIAVALVREARRAELEPWLLLAVLLVENPWLDPDIRSPVGAIGLMQVMPVHRGGWSECGNDLEDIDSNICHGARIFAHYYDRTGGDLDRALLRYNGCVHGTNTPNCHQYPNHVFANAGRASILARMSRGSMAGSP